MAKGRRFNPPLDKDGRWFPHIGLVQKTPESITCTMLKEPQSPRLSRQVEGKLPPIYKVREKQAVSNNFPFSVHDNRHSFQNSGYYFDSKPSAFGVEWKAVRTRMLWVSIYSPQQCGAVDIFSRASFSRKEWCLQAKGKDMDGLGCLRMEEEETHVVQYQEGPIAQRGGRSREKASGEREDASPPE
ncbi:hypothetical protein CB1_001111027 [Camelus ferus]|nr:hypothetical protein CB1_001111027 [Camelus ferus]